MGDISPLPAPSIMPKKAPAHTTRLDRGKTNNSRSRTWFLAPRPALRLRFWGAGRACAKGSDWRDLLSQ